MKIKEQLAQLNGDVMLVSLDNFILAYHNAAHLLEVADDRSWGDAEVISCKKREHDTVVKILVNA